MLRDCLQVNGAPLLSVEYDESDNSESVYARGRDRLLTVRYDSSGRPVRAIPAGPLDGLNITYDPRGRVTGWWRGDLAVSNVYDDRTGLLVEHRIANKILHRFIYKSGNKVSLLTYQYASLPLLERWNRVISVVILLKQRIKCVKMQIRKATLTWTLRVS